MRFGRALVLLAVLALAYGVGFLTERFQLWPYGPLRDLYQHTRAAPGGRWSKRPVAPKGMKGEDLETVLALPYLPGYRPVPEQRGVVTNDAARAFPGLNLYVSGHAAAAILMDMEGRELHRWQRDYAEVWQEPSVATGAQYWRRAHLFDSGDLLAIFEGIGLVKLDRESHLLWAYRGGCHHDLEVGDDGTLWVLTRQGGIVPRINPDQPILEDFVTHLDADGKVLERISLLEAFEHSAYAPTLRRMAKAGDVFHTNTLEVFDGRFAALSPLFRKGNVLISVLYLDTVAILDVEQKQIVWALSGLWHRQHQPTLIDGGHLLVFDNRGAAGRSRVTELDPFSQEIVWQYADAAERPLSSEWNGAAQRLPNGNTLISESDAGRALEVDRAGETVWEFYNPNRAGKNDELIATLFEVVRTPPADHYAFLGH